ncbi:hypothetical protein AQPE_3053 [Aquipluma nitroreducens]|uniref:DegT/DnrJ/EryC1/StrS aminotransferase family protein n=1 Tax=Aquipluma nitroreducens TaxID=2010828 RepID=A0A5K7SBC8_9BACT|nr:DegT/DnrJ/EryC1/StrS family aminotransferase [Aquipluma nitroreducens]BBE18883.1 hypothetical protein AQPE_3053 [Aquipluma nitroreducens]
MRFVPRYFQEISFLSFMKIPLSSPQKEDNFTFFLNSARGSIKWVLKNLNVFYNKTYKMGVPCYSCFSIIQSIIESDNIPVLLDINPLCFELTNEEKLSLNKIDILLWINYFGFKYNHKLQKIREEYPHLIIIEDCSHVDFRDFKRNSDTLFSQFYIFSFNFRKPIVTGGGSALIVKTNYDFSDFLKKEMRVLPTQKIGITNWIKILGKNIAYNSFVFPIVKKSISSKRSKSFNLSIPLIDVKKMDLNQRRLFTVQLKSNQSINRYKQATINYFRILGLDYPKHSFGSNCYFPIPKSNQIYEYLDTYILWENLYENYKLFNICISKEEFPITFHFFENYTFLPAKFFHMNSNIHNFHSIYPSQNNEIT